MFGRRGSDPASSSQHACVAAAGRLGWIPRLAVAVGGAISRHRVFAIALAVAAAARLVTELGYRWALWFNDSFDYVAIALRLRPDPMRPIGYPVLLWLLRPSHSLLLVTSLQHLLGLATALLGYLLLRGRFGLPGWGATLAMTPVLFDAFQIQLEQLLLADTLFTFLAVAAVTLLCRLPASDGGRMSVWQAATAGLLLALASLARPVGIPLIVIAVGYLIICRVGWRAVIAATAAAAAPLAGGVLWYHAIYGQFALDATNGIYLWGRTAAFADCAIIKPPPAQAWLCPPLPPAQRAASAAQVWQPTSPFHWQHGQVFSARENDLAMRFALRAIAAQPAGLRADRDLQPGARVRLGSIRLSDRIYGQPLHVCRDQDVAAHLARAGWAHGGEHRPGLRGRRRGDSRRRAVLDGHALVPAVRVPARAVRRAHPGPADHGGRGGGSPVPHAGGAPRDRGGAEGVAGSADRRWRHLPLPGAARRNGSAGQRLSRCWLFLRLRWISTTVTCCP